MYPGSSGVLSNGGVKSSTSPSPRRTRYSSTAAIARRLRSLSPAPEMTAQDCAIESIRHSSLAAEPSGVPSSKKARRYQSPSQPALSTAIFRASTCARHRSMRALSPRLSASFANSQRFVCRNHASQTLSPFPPIPTRFIPSFQSPAPINGSPWGPTPRLRSSGRPGA